MATYQRLRPPGGTFFFTVNLADRDGSTLTDRIDVLRSAFAATIREAPIRCDAMVVLPGHCHAVWTLPRGDAAYSERWRRIKARFTHAVRLRGEERPSLVRRREAGLWQRRFWEHTIRDEADYWRHVHYCWADPVRHGLVDRAADWPHSSIGRDIRNGLVTADWRGAPVEGQFGE